MTTCALLMAGLLGTAGTCQPAGAPPGQEPRKELVIEFVWPSVEKWQVEIHEYRFHRGTPKPPICVDMIEARYSPDLRALFEKAKNQGR